MKPQVRGAAILIAGVIAAFVVADLIRGASSRVTLKPSSTLPPEIRAKDVRGEEWTLSSTKGSGPVILSFFATWCGPCRMEMPHLVRLQQLYRDRGLQVILITGEPAATIKAEPALLELPMRIVVGADAAFRDYGIGPIPHTVYINAAGRILKRNDGFDLDGLHEMELDISSLPKLATGA